MSQEMKSYYAIIPANVRYDKRLKASEKLLYGEITALSNETGYCWATNDYFANLYTVDKATVSRWVANLAKYGYIDCENITNNDGGIAYRSIRIVVAGIDEKINRVLTKKSIGIDEKVKGGIDEKVKQNNTYNNNTLEYKEKEILLKEKESPKSEQKPTASDMIFWFDKLYEIYPRKVSKITAKTAFEHKLRGLKKDEAHKKAVSIFRTLQKQVAIWQEEKRSVDYVPYFATWLNANVSDSPHYKGRRTL